MAVDVFELRKSYKYLRVVDVVDAQAILLADMKGRRKLYEQLGMALDETVDVEGVERYYEGIDI
ncbi:MAG: hypothetical protein QGG64_09815 [Candidatus Latescibacteria bacterium]|nr:hypothetical protein [Candidatus Latescibacterota bacterium]